MLGTREVKTGVVFCKDPNLGEDVHWGPGSGEERRAPASAVQGALPPCAAEPVGGEGRLRQRVTHTKDGLFLNGCQVFSCIHGGQTHTFCWTCNKPSPLLPHPYLLPAEARAQILELGIWQAEHLQI